jgi:hypothetical protein
MPRAGPHRQGEPSTGTKRGGGMASAISGWHASGPPRGDHGQDGLPFAQWPALTGRARDHVPGPVAAIGAAYRAFLCRLPLKLDGQLAGFRWTWRSSRSPTRYGVSRTQPMSGPSKPVSHTTRKRPGAAGNIRRRRRADLVAQDLDLDGWRCACRGPGDAAVAQRTARSCPAEMPGRVACTAGLGAMVSPGDSRSCACPARTSEGHGRTVHPRAYRQQEAPLCL